MPILTGAKFHRRRESQKTTVTIEFTSLTFCRVRNFIEIEAFAVLRPKLWPKRRQVQTLTGVKSHRKLLRSMNSASSNWSLCKISWKMVNLIPRSPFPFLKMAKKLLNASIYPFQSFGKIKIAGGYEDKPTLNLWKSESHSFCFCFFLILFV